MLTAGLVAGICGVIIAPQLVMAFGLPPGSAFWRTLQLLVYESALWGAGLAVGLLFLRLGWLRDRWDALVPLCAPLIIEGLLSLLWRQVPLAYISLPAFFTRIFIGAVAVGMFFFLTRPRKD